VVETAREEGLAEGREMGLAEGREVGLAEGREMGLAEGRAEAIAAVIQSMTAAGFSQAEIDRAIGNLEPPTSDP